VKAAHAVPRLLSSIFGFFLTWWGLVIVSALDSSVLIFVPFSSDALVVYLAARRRDLFWLYPVLATAGSLTGAAVTYWIGYKVGELGLDRFVPERRLEQLKARVKRTGAVAMALPALLPPPFPLTAFTLTGGALELNKARFFTVFAAVRLIRFGAEALVARLYGAGVLRVLESGPFRLVVFAFIVLAVGGTIISGVAVWRRTRRR
jgi:membrane protein YqaA with SNARE-associated domain